MQLKPRTYPLIAQHATALVLGLLLGCGTNVFKNSETEDPAEDATLALERGEADEAIELLTSALEDDPGNPKYLSVLSLAYAQRAGVEPLQFAQNFANNSNESSDTSQSDSGQGDSSSSDQFTLMFALLPDPTDTIVADIDLAVDILANQIAAADRLPGDEFKLAMFQTASVVLHTKIFDSNFDGDLTTTELENLSAEDAASLLSQISSARTLLATSDPNNDAMVQASQKIAGFEDDINAQDGATDEEKLKNFLAGTDTTTQ